MHFHHILLWLKEEECHSVCVVSFTSWLSSDSLKFSQKRGRECEVHCDVNAHACLHGDPFIFNPTLTRLFWVFSGGRLEVPLHVIMCAAVQ